MPRIPDALIGVLFGVPVLERAEVAVAVALDHPERCGCDVCAYAAALVR